MNEVHPGRDEDVPDPWYGPEPGYHEVYAMIDAAADKIVAKYGPEPLEAARPQRRLRTRFAGGKAEVQQKYFKKA